jgi:hypothetical protein
MSTLSAALEHMLAHLDGVDAQLGVLEHELVQIATREPYSDPVRWLCSFRGIAIKTALGLLAEIGDFRRFASARELMSYLGLTVSEYSSGDRQHRGHLTQDRQPPRPPAADRGRMALPAPAATLQAHRRAHRPCPTGCNREPGTHRSACITATATSPRTASARPSPSRANSHPSFWR